MHANTGIVTWQKWPTSYTTRQMEATDTQGKCFFFFSNSDHLLEHQDKQWFCYTRAPSQRQTLIYHQTARLIAADNKPRHLQYAKVIMTKDTITVNRAADIKQQQPLQANHQQELFYEWGIATETQGQEHIVVEAITNGYAVAVSNGSFQEQVGLAACTIESQTHHHRIRGQGRTPGTSNNQGAYRSELFGIWGILTTLQQIIKKHQIQKGGVLLACDRLTALKQAQVKYPVDPHAAHYDLIGAIRTICKELPIKIKFEHVKGHQDSRQLTALTRLATMNVEMDAVAKQTIDAAAIGPKQYQLGHEPWVCYMGGE